MEGYNFGDILRYYREQHGTIEGTEELDVLEDWKVAFEIEGKDITVIFIPPNGEAKE